MSGDRSTGAATCDVAVILAAGRGTRMRAAAGVALSPEQAAAADRGLKMLVPIHGRPYLAHGLDQVAAAGFAEAVLVVGPDRDGAPDPVRAAALDLDVTHRSTPARSRARPSGAARTAMPAELHAATTPPLRLSFAVQTEPKGGAHALLAAEADVGDGPFVVLNADNIYPCDVLRRLRALDGPGLAAFERDTLVRQSNIPAERVDAFALIRADDQGCLRAIVEKPSPEERARLRDAPVSMTCWRFDRSIFDACRAVRPSARGELELPDAVAHAIAHGARFRVVPVRAGVLDISRREDVPALERLLETRS